MIHVEIWSLVPAAGAAWGIWRLMNRDAKHPPTPAPENAPRSSPCWPEPTLAVMNARALLHEVGASGLLHDAQGASRLTVETWRAHVMPAVDAVAELVQLLPASESHHHAQPGGLLQHTIETLLYAVRLRGGHLMPPGADSEEQGRVEHLWTVGLCIAALNHDVGKIVSDLVVTLYDDTSMQGRRWQPLTASMREAGAVAYAVGFPPAGARDYGAHQRLGATLVQRLVPTQTMAWIGQDSRLVAALLGYLAGELSDNPIASIVSAAERESVRRNLAQGSRTRFASARTVPLIEHLMDAIRAMLGTGALPLNRAGAAGFVFEGAVWFASARLANECRDWLRAHRPDASCPSEDKNDRIYDTFQEYGACLVNPATGGAIWSADIELPQHRFQLNGMLRFALDKLYQTPESYPAELLGRVLVRSSQSQQSQTAVLPQQSEEGANAPDSSSAPGATVTSPAEPGAEAVATANSGEQQAPKAAKTPKAPAPTTPSTSPTPEGMRLPNLPPIRKEPPPSPAMPPMPPAPPLEMMDGDDFLDDEDDIGVAMIAARAEIQIPAARSEARQAPTMSDRPIAPQLHPPKSSKRAKTTKAEAADGPGEAATRFMGWIQQGLASGSLAYNEPKAMVHFVRYKDAVMMLLISPLIFRKFAEEFGEAGDGSPQPPDNPVQPGMGIQLAFARAGWHLAGAKGRGVHSFQVVRRDNAGGNLVNGFLIPDPQRFVDPVPPPNERLIYWAAPGIDPKADL